ncbi:MAG: FHA domain-containing protein [Methanomicrobiaceae archaeon]|nr:FHA domain-containing protein [Methanomicrobiaceae archaeon]
MVAPEGEETIVLEEEPDFYEELSEYLEVLGSATRLKIIKSIEKKPKDIREISSEIETSYENTKKHLDKLLRAGVIKKEAGLSRPTAKGVHPVWKYSLIPGGLEAIIRNLGVFSNMGPALSRRDMAGRIREVQEIVAGELGELPPALLLLGGASDGQVYVLTKPETRIGRADPKAAGVHDQDVMLAEDYGAVTRITKPHAVIQKRGPGCYIEDRGSTGGTVLNGKPLIPGVEVLLQNGDVIDLGKGNQAATLVFTSSGSGKE